VYYDGIIENKRRIIMVKLAVGEKWPGETVKNGCVFEYDDGGAVYGRLYHECSRGKNFEGNREIDDGSFYQTWYKRGTNRKN